jgi:MFS family permease
MAEGPSPGSPRQAGAEGHAGARSLWTSGFFAAAILGDSALYVVLSAFAPRLGLSLLSVGVLLSANRWIRLAANPLAARASERWGLDRLYLGGLGAAALTTACWIVPLPFPLWLAARLGWGFAFAALRLARLATVAEAPTARAAGLSQAVVRTGSAAAVLSAGLLAGRWGFYAPFRVYTVLGAAGAVGAAWGLVRGRPWGPRRSWRVPRPGTVRAGRRIALGLTAFTGQLVVDGALTATLGYFIASRFAEGPQLGPLALGTAAFAGIVLSGRWTAELFLARLLGGWMDRMGGHLGVVTALVLIAAGLAGVAEATTGLALGIGAAAVWVGRTALGAGLDAEATQATGTRPAADLARYATLGDLGSAAGPILAGLAGAPQLPAVYLLGAALLAITAAAHLCLTHRAA